MNKLGIINPHHKIVSPGYAILFNDVLTFPDIMNFFWFP